MIEKKVGNLVDAFKTGNGVEGDVALLVHGCNTLGMMGAGIALGIKTTFPEVYDAYKRMEKFGGGLNLGDVDFCWVSAAKPLERTSPPTQMRAVVNAMTQDKVGRTPGVVYCSYEAIRAAFACIRSQLEDSFFDGAVTVHFPLIGCGLAGGYWDVVSKIIDEELPDTLCRKILWTL